MPNILGIYNLKGGVGKTFLTYLIATFIPHIKPEASVLIIDMDPQANTSEIFVKENELDYTDTLNVSKIFQREPLLENGEDILFETRFENIHILPSHLLLAQYEMQAYTIMNSTERLKMYIETFCLDYDYIIIDNPPSWNIFTSNVLMASHDLVVPIIPDKMSIQGINLVKPIITNAQRFNKNLNLLGYAINFVDRRYKSHIAGIEILQKFYKDMVIMPVLGRRSEYQKSIDLKKPLYLFQNHDKNQNYIDAVNFVSNILERIEQKKALEEANLMD